MKRRTVRKRINKHKKLWINVVYAIYGIDNNNPHYLCWSNNKRKMNKLYTINKERKAIYGLFASNVNNHLDNEDRSWLLNEYELINRAKYTLKELVNEK